MEGEPVKPRHCGRFVAAAILIPVLGVGWTAKADAVKTRIGKLGFEFGVPTELTVAKLYDELDFQRACQLYLWALPAVNLAQMRAYILYTAGGRGNGDIVVFKGYRSLSGLLTPNVTTPYVMGTMDLAVDGPIVVDVPAGLIAGAALDAWQRPLVDFGVAGADKGQGAKYLFVGPGQESPQAKDVTIVRTPTLANVFFYRALDPDPAKAEMAEKSVRTYPWSQRENPPATRTITPDAGKITDVPAMPRGMAYWERLAEFIQAEPVQERDRFFTAMLRPLGIEKGKPFRPDARQKTILTDAAFVGESMAKAIDFDKRFPNTRYRPDAHWDYAVMLDPAQDVQDYSQLDERAAWFYEAIGLTNAMISSTPGVGQAYLAAYRDKDGHAFDGGQTYRLHVPANPPAKQFWSVTLYDVDTRALIQNTEQIADRSSRMPELVKNADGTVDLFFGPTAPKGFEKNWIPTSPGRSWFAWLRLYAPLQAYFDKSWPLPDIEKVR
jgi:hypothetical protein